jgi:hypothetical protein
VAELKKGNEEDSIPHSIEDIYPDMLSPEDRNSSSLEDLEDSEIIFEFMETQMGEFNSAIGLGDLLVELHDRKFLTLTEEAVEIYKKATVV